jgi:3'-phosphoadenosine 5'-phosphosulfate sulfotransferase (PAPS reductase)/FAD synthetase
MSKVRHVLGISGGKDSAALAIYLRNNYPELDIEYYFADTGKELDETYQFIENLEIYLGKKITQLRAIAEGPVDPFDYYLKWMYNGFLPSPKARWCTRHLKLEPFERDFVKDDMVVSYVAIRGDEDREGYISHKPNIQSIFPFRKNIWSEEVISNVLNSNSIEKLVEIYRQFANGKKRNMILEIVRHQLSPNFDQDQKLHALLNLSIATFNRVVFEFLKTTDYPLSKVDHFPLLDNEDILGRDEVFRLLEDSGVGKPKYYKELPLEVNGKKGTYFRSRSGCYFCFFQQKIEWIWLYEQHRDRFEQAREYEKDDYTWNEDERLEDLVKPERMKRIKEEYLEKTAKNCRLKKSKQLLDILLDESEIEGCVACFV